MKFRKVYVRSNEENKNKNKKHSSSNEPFILKAFQTTEFKIFMQKPWAKKTVKQNGCLQ